MSYLKRIGLPLQKFILPFIAPMAVLLTAVSLQLWQPYPIEFTRNLVFDQYNRWLPRHEQDSPVVFVDIDEASLARLGQFPWPRSVFADLVDNMTGYGSAAIAFDILYTEADRTAPAEILPVWENLRLSENASEWQALRAAITAQITSPDDALARAIADAPVIMATMMSDEAARLAAPKAGIAVRAQGSSDTDGLDPMRNVPASSFAISNRDVLNDNALGLGSINARIDDDGIIRRASLLFRAGEHIYPSLALESLRVAQGAGSIVLRASDVRGEGSYSAGFGLSRLKVGRLIAPIEPDGSMRLYFAESADIQTVSAYEILQPDFDMTRLAGKIAFIGTSAAGLKDIRATPLNPATPVSVLDSLMGDIDLILVMSVNPGFGGQSFIESQLEKIKTLRAMIDASGRDIELEVDGGVNRDTAARVIEAGASMLVAGTATFQGGPDKYAENISALREAAVR